MIPVPSLPGISDRLALQRSSASARVACLPLPTQDRFEVCLLSPVVRSTSPDFLRDNHDFVLDTAACFLQLSLAAFTNNMNLATDL